MKKLVWLMAICIFQAGCAERENAPASDQVSGKDAYAKYAKGFSVSDQGTFQLLSVFDPWQHSRGIIFKYVLAQSPDLVPDSLSDLPFISVPVQKVITMSTTHVAMIEHLGMSHTIKGASGTNYIYSPLLREKIESGRLKDVGYDQGLNYETIVSLKPDVLFLYGVESSVAAIAEKLKELGVPAVFCGDYLEPHPLGKAEWIKFFSIFYGLEKQSEERFANIDSAYHALLDKASSALYKPKVLTGLPWKDTWYMAGGKSFAARLIKDAGGDFLWEDNPSTQAIPLDLESVYGRAVEADIWINPGAADNLLALLQFDERFKELPVLNNGEVYNNNVRLTEGGGNDYWESGSIRPDLLLADLIAIFHPDVITEHQFTYYRKLK